MTTGKAVRYGGVVIALLVLVGVGVFISQRKTDPAQANVIHPEVLLNNVPYEVRFYLNPFYPKAGDTVHGKMEVRLDGELINLENNSILPHVTVVSNTVGDLAFHHATETLIQTSTGVYEFRHVLADNSNYTFWIEMNDNTGRDHHGLNSDYVARIAVTVDGASPAQESAKTQNAYMYTGDAGEYVVRLVNDKVVAEQPQQLRVRVETTDGEPVYFLDDFDHYFVVTSPEQSMYLLDHPDHTRSTTQEVVTNPVYFPAPGKYGFWIRLFAANEDGTFRDYLDGKFVVDVAENAD